MGLEDLLIPFMVVFILLAVPTGTQDVTMGVDEVNATVISADFMVAHSETFGPFWDREEVRFDDLYRTVVKTDSGETLTANQQLSGLQILIGWVGVILFLSALSFRSNRVR